MDRKLLSFQLCFIENYSNNLYQTTDGTTELHLDNNNYKNTKKTNLTATKRHKSQKEKDAATCPYHLILK